MVIGGWRGPGWRVFDADPGLCKMARDWIGAAIVASSSTADPEDARVAVSEFFGNAIMHGPGGSVLVAYCLWPDGARVVVCDAGGRGEPRLRNEPGQEGGRGLRVVNEISAQWGSFVWGQSRVVWCDLAGPLVAAPTDAWAWLRGVLTGVDLNASQVPSCQASRMIALSTASESAALVSAGEGQWQRQRRR